jgi:phosphinothricin acetyltransferase
VISIREARPGDAEAIAAIYAHHVLHGTASFEEEPPSVEAWRDKIDALESRRWPFVVAQDDGEVLGYAYATQLPSPARTASTSIRSGWGKGSDAACSSGSSKRRKRPDSGR